MTVYIFADLVILFYRSMMLAYYACFIAMETDHILIISLVGAQLRKSDSTEYRLHTT